MAAALCLCALRFQPLHFTRQTFGQIVHERDDIRRFVSAEFVKRKCIEFIQRESRTIGSACERRLQRRPHIRRRIEHGDARAFERRALESVAALVVYDDWPAISRRGAFRGGGQYLRLEAYPGSRFQRYMVSLTEPYLLGTNVSGTTSLSYFDRNYFDYFESRYGGTLGLGLGPLISGWV